jgi:hypothetical protein
MYWALFLQALETYPDLWIILILVVSFTIFSCGCWFIDILEGSMQRKLPILKSNIV